MKQVSFTALVGSHNYGLNHIESDKDFKTFFIPTFKDLYTTEGDPFSDKINDNDHEYHDVRKLGHLLTKSNINFLEILYSKQVTIEDTLYENLQAFRNDIATMNLSYLYDSTVGTYYNEMGKAQKSYALEEWTKFYKHMMTAMRSLYVLERFAKTDFKDFKKAMSFLIGDSDYETLMYIRLGNKDPQMLLNGANDMHRKVELKYKHLYKQRLLCENTKHRLQRTIMIHVQEHLKKELIVNEATV